MVRRLQMQVSTLQARLRVSETRSAGHHVATTGQASASLRAAAGKQHRGVSPPGAQPGEGAAPPRASPRTTSPRRRGSRGPPPPASPTVDGALDRFYRYLEEGSGATGPARWRQARELVAELKAMGDAGTEALARVLASGRTSSEERRTAAQLLGEMQDPRALPLLQDVLDKDGDVLLRRAAAAGAPTPRVARHRSPSSTRSSPIPRTIASCA